MAYDEHAPGTNPGPVPPYGWVQAIIAYARATIDGSHGVRAAGSATATQLLAPNRNGDHRRWSSRTRGRPMA